MKTLTFILLVVFITTLVCGALFAQDVEPKVEKKRTLWDMIQAGGIVGYIIILLSLVGTAFAIQYGIALKKDKLAPPELLVQLEETINSGNIDEAIATCEAAGETYLGKTMMGALVRTDSGYEEMVKGLEETAQSETFRMNSKIGILALIAGIGPLLGLLGTVTGMISAFQTIESMKAPAPADLARGVYEALVTTVQGLVVGIIFLAIHFIFKNKLANATLTLDALAGELISRLKGETQKGSKK
jgi:biopolymer transport protein ExbB